MYAMLWKALPGPTWLRVLQCLIIALVVVWLLMSVIFPWLAEQLPINDVAVG